MPPETATIETPRVFFKTWETKSIDDEKKQTTGLLTTDQPDRDGEWCDQETVWDLMPGFIARGVMLFMHGVLAPVGVPKSWEKWRGTIDGQKRNGTLLTAEVRTDHDIIVQTGLGAVIYDAKNVWQLIKQQLLRSHSFGFLAAREDMRNGLFKLSVKDILEASYVTIPANPGAMFEMAKMLGTAILKAPDVPVVVVPRPEDMKKEDWTRVLLALSVAQQKSRMVQF